LGGRLAAVGVGITVSVVSWLCCASAWAAEGDLDPSFGFGGVVTTDIGTVENAMTIDAQGRIVAVGYVANADVDIVVARYLANGTLDPAFSGDGVATFNYPGGASDDGAYDVTVDAGGGILVAGGTNVPHNFASEDFTLIRVSPDGTLDTGFGPAGSGGYVRANLFSNDQAEAVAVDSQGRIVVGGTTKSGGDFDFAVVRYDANGNLDTSFGNNGQKTVDFTPDGGDQDFALGMVIDAQGRIVLAGHTEQPSFTDTALARLNSDGSRDATFGPSTTPNYEGQVTTAMSASYDDATAVTLDAQNKIVVAGSASVGGAYQFALARYNADGSLDTTFSDDGKVLSAIEGDSSEEDLAFDVAIDSHERIVVAGRVDSAAGIELAVARYDPNGALDQTFGIGGKATVANAARSGATSFAFDDHERIVIAGNLPVSGGGTAFGLARLIGDAVAPAPSIGSGPAEGSFTNDPTPTFEFTSSEAETSFGCGFDGFTANCASPFIPGTPLSEGAHTFSLAATDRAGNTSAAVTRAFTVDTRAPEIDITGKKKVKTHRKKGRDKLTIETSEASSLRCAVDEREPEDCVEKFITPKLKKGKHVVTVTATDQAGNSGTEDKSIKVVRKKP
jgi:uncharacterized delta-60 repeat protein